MRTKSQLGPQSCWLLRRNWAHEALGEEFYERRLDSLFNRQLAELVERMRQPGRRPDHVYMDTDQGVVELSEQTPELLTMIFGHPLPTPEEIARAEALYGKL